MDKAAENEDSDELINPINVVSSFLAHEQIPDLKTCPPVDCIVICISALIFQGDRLFRALEARPWLTKTLVLVGGIGHSTKLLWDAVSRHGEYHALRHDIQGLPEARVMEKVLKNSWDVEEIESAGCKILIEDQSTNCGSNAIETRKVLEAAGVPTPRSCLIIQDPTMSRRTLASFQKAFEHCGDPPEFTCCPLFVPSVRGSASGLQFANDIQSERLWDMDRFLELILGEIPRLRDDEHGYGPNGKGFIGHVDIPPEVEESWTFLNNKITGGRSI